MKKQQKKSQAALKILGLGASGLVGLFVLLFFALPAVCPSCVGWIGLSPPGKPTQALATNSENIPVGTQLGERAPNFTLTDVDETGFQLSEFRGKPTIVYFSASWCTPCIPETQALARLKARYSDLQVVWISVDPAGDSQESLLEHRSKYARDDFIYALDTLTNDVARQYQVKALGTFYLLDRDQRIVFEGVRSVGTSAFTQALERVVRP